MTERSENINDDESPERFKRKGLKYVKDMQYGNKMLDVIKWDNLSKKQKWAFLDALIVAISYINDKFLDDLIIRENKFNKNSMDLEIIDQTSEQNYIRILKKNKESLLQYYNDDLISQKEERL